MKHLFIIVITLGFAHTSAAETLGGGFFKSNQQPVPQASTQTHNTQKQTFDHNAYTFKDAPQQAKTKQEYRGFNGRTVKQAFFSCKYQAFRAAVPGESRIPILSKVRIRMYVMDTCMNAEGFFRKTGASRFSTDLISGGDFFY